MNPNRKRPPTWFHALAYPFIRAVFWLMGWRALGQMPNLPKCVLIFSPHTSYTDNYLLAAIQACYHFEGNWLAAEKLFKNPLMRRFLLWAGARPVDRSQSHNLVSQYAQEFATREHMILGIAPSGTRQYRPHWKTGFYWIALEAGVPIVCLSIDYSRKRIEIGPVVQPSGDIYADMRGIAPFYAGKVGRHPERQTPVLLPPDIDLSHIQEKAS